MDQKFTKTLYQNTFLGKASLFNLYDLNKNKNKIKEYEMYGLVFVFI